MVRANTITKEDDVKSRFRRCVKMELGALRKVTILYLATSLVFTACYEYSMFYSPIVYHVVWFLTVYGTLGLLDLGWYMILRRRCKYIANGSLYKCYSECYYAYCGDNKCYSEANSTCTEMCRQTFNDVGQG